MRKPRYRPNPFGWYNINKPKFSIKYKDNKAPTDEKQSSNVVSDCDFIGSFSDKENGKIWITISIDGNCKIVNGENGLLKDISINSLKSRYGLAVSNVVCVKELGTWILIKVNKQEKPFEYNTNYYLDQGFLTPIFKVN